MTTGPPRIDVDTVLVIARTLSEPMLRMLVHPRWGPTQIRPGHTARSQTHHATDYTP